ncbi:MAG: septal ring lytic transglycosylase RlpA family protein [Alphaproteobacteria bacterium]|nr:septal ring lytic transglycosylase RlpA family protein [Alphaproteobacteria bacterium]
MRGTTKRPARRGLAAAACAAAALVLAGCAETQLASHIAKKTSHEIYGTPGAMAGDERVGQQAAAYPPGQRIPPRPIYKVGDPYQIDGTWYYPKEDFKLVETGIASWYGADFHGKPTANGEVYDMNAVSAAHRTLQMPAVVRVTNLENGRSLVLRVNDRGPFARGRIIDLSKRSAELLGVYEVGTAKVRVEVLPDASQSVKEAALRGQPSDGLLQLASLSAPPAAPPPPPPLPEPQLRVVPVGTSSIFIQAGAFSNQENALRVRDAIADLAPTAITPVSTTGQRLFRVRLGPVATVDDADAALERVVKRGYAGARIVVE